MFGCVFKTFFIHRSKDKTKALSKTVKIIRSQKNKQIPATVKRCLSSAEKTVSIVSLLFLD